jgi:hypothetical protein
MRSLLTRSALILSAAAIAWLFAARQLSLLVDRLFMAPLYSLPVSPLAYSLDTLWIGDLPLSLSPEVSAIDVHLSCNSDNRVILSTADRRFTLGFCTRRSPTGAGEFQFIPVPGDTLSLDVSRGIISWPTPFELNFMTGRSPSWRRDLYYRLAWKKPSGTRLTMEWRFEQGFYPSDGWTGGTMTRAGSTGLLAVTIIDAPAASPTIK